MSDDTGVWQKVVDHINGSRIRVESRKGNQYPAETPNERDNEQVYLHMVNEKRSDRLDLWAYVDFEPDQPTVEFICTGDTHNEAPDCHPRDL